MNARHLAVAALAALAIAACAKTAEQAMPPGALDERPAPPGELTSPADQCNAAHYQWLIGKKTTAIPPKPANALWRLACTSCPVTMDYAPSRLNIFFNDKTQVIEQVKCG